ncbi:hypothetical protein TRAPUB_6899 [Trametes pubescens]|uniref:Uncharacterized protein n=1 Tax=Trametes pubescens TaxID=154538 RepID=A0A1M2V4X0_TRAPU|nr:hypothetical protein TRAPUB_6899 [Trametes pubescens]
MTNHAVSEPQEGHATAMRYTSAASAISDTLREIIVTVGSGCDDVREVERAHQPGDLQFVLGVCVGVVVRDRERAATVVVELLQIRTPSEHGWSDMRNTRSGVHDTGTLAYLVWAWF